MKLQKSVETFKIIEKNKNAHRKDRKRLPLHALAINLNPHIINIASFRRRSHYTPSMTLSDKLDLLIEKGICTKTEYAQNDVVNTLSICKQFSMDNHTTMLQDHDRLQYYREAMRTSSMANSSTSRSVQGKTVLEIGTGPYAILAVNAINSGAAFVDALEVNIESFNHAKGIIDQYGFDNVAVHACHSKRFPVQKRKYDMIIHEILGDFASQEGVADVLLDIQQRLNYIPQSIPYAASTVICPAMFPEPDEIRCPSFLYPERTIVSPKRKLFQSVQLNFQNLQLSDFQSFETLQFEEPLSNQMMQKRTLEFVIYRPGLMAGLLCGIDIEIRPAVFFGTRYIGQTNSWYTTLILLPEEYLVQIDDVVEVECTADLQKYDEATNEKVAPALLISRPEYTFDINIKRKIHFSNKTSKDKVVLRSVKRFKKISIPFVEQAPRVYSHSKHSPFKAAVLSTESTNGTN